MSEYKASFPKRGVTYSSEERSLLSRRTKPFLNNGTHYSLEHLLIEAYLQGIRDAVEAHA